MENVELHTDDCGRTGTAHLLSCKMNCACWCHKPKPSISDLPETYAIALLSTSHLSALTRDVLDDKDRSHFSYTVWSSPYGWAINSRLGEPAADITDFDGELEDDLQKVMAFMRERGVTWVMFDGDGPVVQGLKVFG